MLKCGQQLLQREKKMKEMLDAEKDELRRQMEEVSALKSELQRAKAVQNL